MTVMMMSGGPISPSKATAAPGAPPKRVPNTTEKLIMLAPGRNCDSENASLNSSGVIHLRRSTIRRRDHGSAPPKATTDSPAKARNNSSSFGRVGGDSGMGDETLIAKSAGPRALSPLFFRQHSTPISIGPEQS